MRRNSLAYSLFIVTLSGCGCPSHPALNDCARKSWMVVNWKLQVVNVQTGELSTLAPFVDSVAGKPPPGVEPYSLISPGGRYVARIADGNSLCVIDVGNRVKRLFLPPGTGRKLSSDIAWSPDEKRLLCYSYYPATRETRDEPKRGRLFVLSLDERRWTELGGAGWILRRRGFPCVTPAAWEDEHTVIFVTGEDIKRFDLKHKRLETIGKGSDAYSLGPGMWLFKPDDEALTPFVLVKDAGTTGTRRESKLIRGMVMNGRPIVSPDRRYFLFIQTYLTSIWGNAAIGQNLGIYDVGCDTMSCLVRGNGQGMA